MDGSIWHLHSGVIALSSEPRHPGPPPWFYFTQGANIHRYTPPIPYPLLLVYSIRALCDNCRMAFYFGEKTGDELMSKINLRDISSRAKQWDHPVKGLFKYAESMKNTGGDILKLSKKDRERYCVSIVGMALKNDSQLDWWMNMPNQDPPDGLVLTLKEEKPDAYMGYMREIEVVEHRDEPSKIFETIRDKMVKKTYESNTILVCLALTPSMYDLRSLSARLSSIKSSIKHVFVVFTGIMLTGDIPTKEQIQTSYMMVQLLPVFEQGAVDSRPHLNDFMGRYNKGQESRLIEGNRIDFGTTNPKFIGQL